MIGYTFRCGANQTWRSVGADHYDLTYDQENHLLRVDKNDVLNIQLAYDGDGERVKAYNAGGSTSFVGSWYEWTGTGTSYYFLGAKRVAMREGANVTYIHGDHLSSATNTAGAVPSSQRYFPWGARRGTGTGATLFRLTDQRHGQSIS